MILTRRILCAPGWNPKTSLWDLLESTLTYQHRTYAEAIKQAVAKPVASSWGDVVFGCLWQTFKFFFELVLNIYERLFRIYSTFFFFLSSSVGSQYIARCSSGSCLQCFGYLLWEVLDSTRELQNQLPSCYCNLLPELGLPACWGGGSIQGKVVFWFAGRLAWLFSKSLVSLLGCVVLISLTLSGSYFIFDYLLILCM